MGFSYSKVQCYWDCPYKFKLNYVDKLEALPDKSATNALYIGTAAHEGIEKRSIQAAIDSYKSNYSELTAAHELEIFKLSAILEKAIVDIPEGEYEVKLTDPDGFIGYIDCLVKNDDGTYSILDFKCSNNKSGYLESPQIHLYKYYFERMTGNTVRDISYVFIPKANTKLNEALDNSKLEEALCKAKESARAELDKLNVDSIQVQFDKSQIGKFFARKAIMDKGVAAGDYTKHFSTKCKWCEFRKYCSSKGEDRSELTDESINKLIKNEGLFND